MTTLRRELRTKFENVLQAFEDKLSQAERESTAELLADAAIELRGFSLLQNAGLDWSILAGAEITQEQMDKENNKELAPRMFENALGFSKPLPWWDGEKEWREFGEWVCERYSESRVSFGEYQIWRSNQYSSGKLANTTIRSFPNKFYDSWDMFQMSKGNKTDEARPEYQSIEIDTSNSIPNPNKKPRLV